MTPKDTLGRPMRDLRISVTDRCNFRCVYCMPKEVFGRDFRFLDRGEILSFEEIARLAAIFVRLGIEKIRITGGEPLIRRDIEELVAQLARVPGLNDLTLTTNGSLLTRAKAQALRDAGLRRITISLDSLDDEVFRRMNDVKFPVSVVLDAIECAIAVGLTPVKVDTVVRRGMNEKGIVDLAARFRGTGVIPRFIEYMDVGNSNGWKMDDVVPAREVIATLGTQWPIVPVDANYYGEVAERWRYEDGAGEVGIISSVTRPFCSACTRARLSAEGKLYACLFASQGEDLRALLRGGASDEAIAARLGTVWQARDDRYSEIRTSNTPSGAKVEMSHIGG
ncbi:MAG: GTP 3',8-cyclase MoaA [Acidobacteria bacterium]|nr:GTP 3',8-cyclase MoaA [Acidobacteriota bacterium]